MIEVAYNIEAHDIVIRQLQAQGQLIKRVIEYHGSKSVLELGLDWYVLQSHEIKLLAIDCNPDLISRLSVGKWLTMVFNNRNRPDIAFGRNERLIAAIFTTEGQLVYRSPGFDPDIYFSTNS